MPDPAPATQPKTETPPAGGGQPQGGQPTADQLAEEARQKAAALQEARDQNKALREELEVLKRMGHQPQAGQFSSQQQQVDPNVAANAQRLEQLWETDPRRAMQTELQMGLQWYDQVNAGVDTQADDVAKKYADFNNYRSEVNRYVRNLPFDARNRPGVVEAAYFYIKGQRADDLVNLSKEELIAKIKAGESVQGLDSYTSTPATPADPNANRPTQDQVQAANAMGIPVEEYMKFIKR